MPRPLTSAASFWEKPPAKPRLNRSEVHLWRADLAAPEGNLSSLLGSLNGEEKSRSQRFVFERDRNRFVMARGALRLILGSYLEQHPREIDFAYGPYGKPAISGENPSRLCFNLSHSGEIALYVVAQDRAVGVDVEYMKPDRATDAIAERFFSRLEVLALHRLPAEQRGQGFFNCWTRKEAYIKGRGQGLSLPLDQFDVSLVPGEPATLLASRHLPELPTEPWSLREVAVGDGYAAAVAVEGPDDWRLSYWQFPSPQDPWRLLLGD